MTIRRVMLLAACGFAPAIAHAQVRAEVIRGRVVEESGQVVVGANVLATRAPDRAVFTATSDSAGAFVVRIAEGTGDYLVYVSAPGWKSFRKRVTRASESDTSFVVNATLTSAAVQQLATVRVQATKPRPVRYADPGTQTGAREAIVDDFTGAVPPELAGDIAALSGTIPGVTPVGGGISVLGLDPSQNSVTLNGMAMGAGSVPRAARTNVRVSSTTYDPARGWFGGANSNVELSGGSVYTLRDATFSIDAPVLQYSDALSTGLGQRFTNVNGSIGGVGPIGNKDLYVYSYGVEAGRRSGDAVSLLSSDADVLNHAGLAADSLVRFRHVLSSLGIPSSAAAVPSALTTDKLSFIARFDRSQLDARTFVAPKRASAITVFGNWSRTSPLSVGPTTLPTRATSRWNAVGGTQGMFSTYFGNDYLATVRSSFSLSESKSLPYYSLPGASVLVSSMLPSGENGFSSLAFGGGSSARQSTQWTWETIGETQLYAAGHEAHRVSVTADVRLDGYSDVMGFGDAGSFAFNSLAELAAGTPTSFSRVVSQPNRRGGEWNAFAAIGDYWRVSPTLRVQYGARIEGSAFTSSAPTSAALDTALGVQSGGAPGSVHASPRLGFTWIRRGAGNLGALAVNKLGAFHMGPTSYLRGGIGEFRSLLSPSLLSDALVSSRSISCIGTAVPTPDWTAYVRNPEAAPTSCVGSGTLADTAPAARLVSRGFRPARSWRANLSYASQRRWLTYSVDATYSLNLDQPGIVDRNFRSVPAFATSDEGRAVFVPLSSVVPSTGAVSGAAARLSRSFGRVLEDRSDLRSTSRQLIITLAPDLFGVSDWWLATSYVLSATRAQQSGFDGTTFGSPLERTDARGALDARHQFVVRGGYATGGVTLTAFGRMTSGLPFTPIVSADVNGDGFANDRAFVRSSSGALNDCLARQVNSPAARNSCEGPWTTALNMQLTVEGSHLHMGSRLRALHVNLSNPLGGL
ncbi:MAG: carboxypeptidase-like regulatory domain-containing protein, partial [bacterium]